MRHLLAPGAKGVAMLSGTRGATPQPEDQPAEPQDAAAWLRNHGITVAAVTLLALQ